MADDPDRRLDYRLVPADGPADSQVLDDLIRLVRQGIATAPKDAPKVGDGAGFRPPEADERRDLGGVEAKIKHRIEQANWDSQTAVEQRAELVAQPDADEKLASEARRAAELVVAAVQRALLRGVRVEVPGEPPAGPT